MNAKPQSASGQLVALRHPLRRPRRRRRAVRLDGPRQLQARGRAAPGATHLVARAPASLDNYTQLFSRLDFGTYFTNSIVVAVAVTAGQPAVLLDARLRPGDARVPGQERRCSSSCMATLMIPGVVTFVPLFVLVANAGLIDTLPGLFLPFLVSPVRGVPDAAVHPRPATRPARRGARRRCGRAAHLRPDHPAAVRAGPGDARHPHVPRQLEQLPLAAGGGPDRGHLHPARRPGPVLQGPEQHAVRPAARRGDRRRHARSCWSSSPSSAGSSRASPPPASSSRPATSRHPGRTATVHRHDRNGSDHVRPDQSDP